MPAAASGSMGKEPQISCSRTRAIPSPKGGAPDGRDEDEAARRARETHDERLRDYECRGSKGYSDGSGIEKSGTRIKGEMNDRAEGLHCVLTCYGFLLLASATFTSCASAARRAISERGSSVFSDAFCFDIGFCAVLILSPIESARFYHRGPRSRRTDNPAATAECECTDFEGRAHAN